MDRLRTAGTNMVISLSSMSLWKKTEDGEDIELCPEKTIITRKYTNASTSGEETVDSDASSASDLSGIGRPTDRGEAAKQKADNTRQDHSGKGIEDSGTSSAFQAFWNLTNCMQGIGILSLPYTVREGGVAALVTMVVVLFLGNYTSKILVYCMYDDDDCEGENQAQFSKRRRTVTRRRVHDTYADVATAYHRYGGHVLNVLQIIDMTSLAAMYLQLCGALLVDTFPNAGLSQLAWTVISALLLLPTVLLKNLTKVSWLSLLALLSLVVMYGSVVWHSFWLSIHWDVDAIAGFDIRKFSVSASMIIFNFGAQFLMPGVEGSMQKRSQFNLVLNCSYVLTGITNVAYALFACLTFGEDTQEFITYNMPLGPLQAAVSCLFVIKSLLTYPLLIFLIVFTIDSMKLPVVPECYPNTDGMLPPFWAVVFRVLLVALTLILAVAVPKFSLLMSFTGSLIAPWLDFIFPCIFYLKLRKKRIPLYEEIFVWSIVVFSGLAGAMGLFYSLKALILSYSGSTEGGS